MKPSFHGMEIRVPLFYALLGGLWILVSDRLLAAFITDPRSITPVQTYKGWGFVAVSALLIFLLLRRELGLRRLTESKLGEIEDNCRLLFENSMDAILLTAPDGSIHAANPAACRMFEWTESEIKRIGRAGIVDAADPRLAAALEQRSRTGSFHGELTFLRRDGTKFPGEITTSMFKTRDSSDRTSMIIRDIAGRRRAEQALQASQANLSLVFDHTSDMQVLYQVEQGGTLRFLAVNRSYLDAIRLLGFPHYTEDFFAGRSREQALLDLGLPKEGIEADGLYFQRAIESGSIVRYEQTVPAPAGTMHIESLIVPVMNEDGRCTHLLYTSRDISVRKQAENALHESNEALQAVIQAAPVSIVVLDPDGIVKRWNPASERMFGWSEEEALGRFLPYVPKDRLDEHRELRQRVLGGESFKDVQVLRYKKDGSPIFLSVSTAPLHDLAGNITGIMVVNVDITERKAAEEELRLSRDRLADISRRLVEAREAESRAIGRELHDQFAQMLTAIKITLDIAGQVPAELVAGKIAQAQELVDDLLRRVSRLSLELRPPMLDDLGLVPALIWHVNRYQEQTSIEVDFKHLRVEGRRFGSEVETTAYRIIQEALTNVARHARATHVRLEVRTDTIPDDGKEWMEIRIEDDGQGFDPQTAFAMNRGLSGMRERASLLGGAFQAESQAGKGAKKLIRLPLRVRDS